MFLYNIYLQAPLPQHKQAFSLVELSIILVILGLLTGGILTGQNLIHAAELRSVVSEYNNFQTASNTFKSKYLQIPGDMNNAIDFWGDNTAYCTDGNASNNGSPGTCNGNGDGFLAESTSSNNDAEIFLVWNQLALAGLIEGQYTGASGPDSVDHSIIGTNVPPSKFSQGAWGAFGRTTGDGITFNINFSNPLEYGGITNNDDTDTPIMTPEDIWNVDVKIDDGKAGRGKIIAGQWNNCTDAADHNDLDADYVLDEKSLVCHIMFLNAF